MAQLNQNILLTIAIPTYNRADALKQTLQSIVSQSIFQTGNEVEIVISDNCSTDHTGAVAEEFVHTFGEKVKYFRNEENVNDKNMAISLRRGSGLFLKLNNDTLLHKPGALEKMLDVIKSNVGSNNMLYFLNKGGGDYEAANLNDFLRIVSFDCTWIGSFGIWKNDLETITDFERYAKLQLTQVDVLFRIIAKRNKPVFINNSSLFTSIELKKKGGYDLIDVFLENYTFILREYLPEAITPAIYKKETEKLLLDFLCLWMARIDVYHNVYYFEAKNRFSRINKFYSDSKRHLILFYLKYVFYLLAYTVKKNMRRIGLTK